MMRIDRDMAVGLFLTCRGRYLAESAGTPQQHGSAGLRINVASAVTNAVPVRVGTISPFTLRTVPSNTLPVMLSCRQTSPSFSLPSAKRHASFALVPVPHGER